METFEETLMRNSGIKEADLYDKAKLTFEKPETGITINVPAAKFVLQDSAKITIMYLPHFVWAQLANPVSHLKGKVNLEQIQDFVKRSQTNSTTLQLLRLIIDRSQSYVETTSSTTSPYGDYDGFSRNKQLHNDVYVLSKLFGVI